MQTVNIRLSLMLYTKLQGGYATVSRRFFKVFFSRTTRKQQY
jgi:hypothetical protein